MKLRLQILYKLLLLQVLGNTLSAQILTDSAFVAKVEHHITQEYINLLGSEAPIYNGKIYRPFLKLESSSHAFFLNNQYLSGSLVYEGLNYQNLNLMYDLVNDQLILLNFDKTGGIIVPKELVSSFFIDKHHFINIKSDVLNKKDISPGYYQLLYQGEINLLARKTKKIDEIISPEGIKYSISQQDKYYLFKDSAYHHIRNQKDLLQILRSNPDQNLSFLKKEKLDFKKNNEGAMVKLLNFYDSKN